MFNPLPVLETSHLILRELRLSDAEDQLEYAQDDEVAAFGLWKPQKTLQENLDDIQESIRHYAAGDYFSWAVEHRADHKMIGRIQLGAYNAADARADLGYAYNRRYWGKGYATEAAQAVLKIGFESLKLHRVGAKVLPDNVGSIRVLEKLGFQREGVVRQAYSLRGPYEDLLCYSILAPEWREMYP